VFFAHNAFSFYDEKANGMSLSVIYSRANVGISAPLVTVETHLTRGLPQFTIVGLPETAVRESKDRVRSTLIHSGYDFPKGRITVNLAPADLPKEGGRFDLPIAISILVASQQLTIPDTTQYEMAGELGLGGELRGIRGVLPFALASQSSERILLIPHTNANEASWVTPLQTHAFYHFTEVCKHVSGEKIMAPLLHKRNQAAEILSSDCFSQICGQAHAKRALEIAAAGGHSLLMIGPPGTGKTLLASRLHTILPPLSQQEALEVAAIYSISYQGFQEKILHHRPFRRPHHTASAVSLVGGGKTPLPGEISLAHHGILFLDELPEFSRHVLEVLREPLESGQIHLSRAAGQANYPANCQLIAAMNPCPCGYLTDPRRECRCSDAQVQRYANKLSGPLMDRIDMHIEVPALSTEALTTFDPKREETSQVIRERVLRARMRQHDRANMINAKFAPQQILEHCALKADVQTRLTQALDKLGISARAYHRILKVARTIADLADSPSIESDHIIQALQYRKIERQSIRS
jgi:magnesium chelatase family protein